MTQEELNERYRGHLSLCEIDTAGQQRIARARVLVVGAGGLGSPVALYLGAAGVGSLGIVDADTVGLSNLQRQIMHTTADLGRPKADSAREAVEALNPAVKVTAYREFLTGENAERIIGDYDIVVDCTDSRCSRRLVSSLCVSMGKPLVYGAVSRFSGMVFTHLPGTCAYDDIFADGTAADEAPSCAQTGILNSAVGVIGSIQATEVLKIITRTGELLTDRLLFIDLLTMSFDILPLARSSR